MHRSSIQNLQPNIGKLVKEKQYIRTIGVSCDDVPFARKFPDSIDLHNIMMLNSIKIPKIHQTSNGINPIPINKNKNVQYNITIWE